VVTPAVCCTSSDNPSYQQLIFRLSALDTDEGILTQLGQMLFAALFQGPVKELYARSQGQLKDGQALRLLLNIDAHEVKVAVLPWEFLNDPDDGPLSLRAASVVRYLPQPAPTPILKTELPLNVLLTGAQTPPQPDVTRELDAVQAALADLEQRGLVRITVESHLTPQKLHRLLRQDFHIWHFVGHGGFDQSDATGRLYFEDDTGDVVAVSAGELGVLLRGSGVRLVVLDACKGGRLATYPFRSVTPALIRAQVPAVIAMQFSVPEAATRAFSGEFYRALAAGLSIDASVTEGRRAVMLETGIGRPDWGIPVVYTRARDGKLFELPSPAADHQPLPTDGQASESPIKPVAGPARVFISYKRNTQVDEPLARRLYRAFQQAGHRPFIDQTIPVGVEWAREIERQIEQADFMVVLLSATSVHSEMVATEIEFAHRQSQRSGNARLLPVRVDFDDLLPYQISAYIDKLQYAEWYGEPDTERLIGQLLAALEQRGTLPLHAGEALPSPGADLYGSAPRPFADPRFIEALREPGGGVKLRSEFYIERDADRRLLRELVKAEGTTTTIRATRQTGKTSLLIRGVALAQNQGSRVVYIDLQTVEERYLESLDTFLRYFATIILTKLRLDPGLAETAWRSALGAPDKLTYLMEDHILSSDVPIVLALDEADRLLKASFRDNFFGLLRSWHNARAMNDLWDRLDILMVIATEPSLLIADQNQSPFNVGSKIVLEDFTLSQVAELNSRYRSPLGDRELPALGALLGGHPYLTSKALYTLVMDTPTWEQFAQVARTTQGPFSDHLRHYLALLNSQPQLKEALQQVILHGRCPDETQFYRLIQAGLVRGGDSQPCQPRCALYAEYFKDKI
jgi:hypothetical protein